MSLSVLILSYNHAAYIRQAIDSVILQSNYIKDIELLILDDGSTDGTPEILKEVIAPPGVTIRTFLNEHKGVNAIAANFNFLISAATKKYIAFLASDDFYCPDAFKEQIEFLDKKPRTQLVYGNGVNICEGKIIGRLHDEAMTKALLSQDPSTVIQKLKASVPQLYIQSLIMRRDFLQGFSAFDEELIADDWAFNIRVFTKLAESKLEYHFLDQNVFFRRLLSTSTSNNIKVHFSRILQVARKYISNDSAEFYTYLYIRYAKTFIKEFKFTLLISMVWRLILLKLGSKKHSDGLEQLL